MLKTIYNPALPKLAWIGTIRKSDLSVTVIHGKDVEITDQFIVEGVWDEDFASGNFHQSENFFGSGLKIEDGAVWLVPSTSLVDRLLYCENRSTHFVSNSLVCLLAYLDAGLIKENNYKEQSDAILKGIHRYDPNFPISHKEIKFIRQLFYFPLKIDLSKSVKFRRSVKTTVDNYSSYYSALRNSLLALRRNSKDPGRKKTFLAYSTVSRGYDSTAVTALTHDLDIEKVFTSKRSSSGLPAWINSDAAIDDGTIIAKKFGLDVSYLDFKASDIGEDELLFSCPTPAEPEIIFYKAYQHLTENESPSLMFTGYHGDKLWDKNVEEKYLTSDIIRGDTSGLNLSEARLSAGFINVAVPFLYAEQIERLHKISNSDQLKDWSIGGDYDRPIPRRIAEDAGIERSAFGIRKKAVITFYNRPFNRTLQKHFNQYLKDQLGISQTQTLMIPVKDRLAFYAKKIIGAILEKLNITSSPALTFSSLNLPYHLFFWSLERQVSKQSALLEQQGSIKANEQDTE